MLVLEIAAGVTTIVSAFVGGTTLFYEWRDQRRQRRAARANADTSRSASEPLIQREDGEDSRRHDGPVAIGDENPQVQFKDKLILLQTSLMSLLQSPPPSPQRGLDPISEDAATPPSPSTPVRTTEVRAKKDQRTPVGTPVGSMRRRTSSAPYDVLSLSDIKDAFCPGALALQENPSLPLSSIMRISPGRRTQCDTCRDLHPGHFLPGIDIPQADTPFIRYAPSSSGQKFTHFKISARFFAKSHRKGMEGGGYVCVFCVKRSNRIVKLSNVQALVKHLHSHLEDPDPHPLSCFEEDPDCNLDDG